MLEETSEMVWKIETKEARCFADVVPLHQQTLGLIDDIVVDVADSRATRCLVDDVTEIAWRICQLRSTVADAGQTVRQLSVLAEKRLELFLKACQLGVGTFVLFR